MPLRLDIKRTFTQRSERVKGIDIHPTEPWILTCLYSGHVYIWNYADQSLVKSFEVTDLPVRTAKFVARKQWIVCGSDDMMIRVFNYNTLDKVKQWEAHADYIRHVAVHPTLPYLLTASDDMTAKLWDWEKGWQCAQVFEGHAHYVMAVAFNPRDPNTFASASLDRTVKVWGLGSPVPNFTLEGHERGVNAVDYHPGGDRPYLASGADDRTVRVWDYTTKACLRVLDAHAHNVSAVAFHPGLPLLLTGSEDGTVRAWHAATWRLEESVPLGVERVWTLAASRRGNAVAVGGDEGCALLSLGRDEPVASMDAAGKVVAARQNDVVGLNLRQAAQAQAKEAEEAAGGGPSASASALFSPEAPGAAVGERLAVPTRELGSSELYPASLQHSPNGRFVAAVGDDEYVIYTALAWRSKAFGPALELVWGAADAATTYATRTDARTVHVHRNFKDAGPLVVSPQRIAGIHGGALLGVRTADGVSFHSWADGSLVRRVDVEASRLWWSDGGDLVAIAGDDATYVLRHDPAALDDPDAARDDEDGVEGSLELEYEIPDGAKSGKWIGDCFVYVAKDARLCYAVGGDVAPVAHLAEPSTALLGYLPATERLYVIDRDLNVTAYPLSLRVVEFKSLVARGDLDAADAALEGAPNAERDALARFLEANGHLARALRAAVDPDARFDLAARLGLLDEARDLARRSGSAARWSQLGELALARGRLELAREALDAANDLPGLLLLHAARGDAGAVAALAERARHARAFNVAFAASFAAGDADAALQALLDAKRLPEATMFARAYLPSRVSELLALWKDDLAQVNAKAAAALADPAQSPDLFPRWALALRAERAARVLDGAERQRVREEALEDPKGGDVAQRLAAIALEGGDGGAQREADEVDRDADQGMDVQGLENEVQDAVENENEVQDALENEDEDDAEDDVLEEPQDAQAARGEEEEVPVEEDPAPAFPKPVSVAPVAPVAATEEEEEEEPGDLDFAEDDLGLDDDEDEAPSAPAPAPAPAPASAPAPSAYALTPAEEALLAEDDDDDAFGGVGEDEDLDLGDEALGDDDWGLDEDADKN